MCHLACPAEVWRVGRDPARVFLRRTCPVHGEFAICIASDARFYWLAKGNPSNTQTCCGSANGCAADHSRDGTLGVSAFARGDKPFETLSTCLALIEIVRSCNLSCPTCYADSPMGLRDKVDAVPLANLQTRIQPIIDRKGPIEILQLSGGEPTLHPELFELLEWAQAHVNIKYLLLNTNGVRLARDAAFTARLGRIFARGGLQIYLQFDGVRSDGQQWLRGADLRAIRQRAIECCAEAALPVTLAMTVTHDNLPHVWPSIEFGLQFPHVHGITFQPLFGSGRLPDVSHIKTPINTADVLLAAIEQSSGRLRAEDFTPLPCGDPNCAIIGYLLRMSGGVHSISEFIDFADLQGFLQSKLHYTLADLARCGCESEPLGALLKSLELKSSMTFRLMIKPFMDAHTWDQDRIDRCCTHVIRPDGKLDSFCRYYSGFPDAREAP